MKFTVIIPSRERADTLYHTLRTCVSQRYSNLRILVSDNNSGDNTKDVVDSFSDDRIHYINTGHRVSMSSNWEFALSYVDNGFVTYMGDDDGLLPNAIHDVSRIIKTFNTQAVTWKKIEYCWPSHPKSERRGIMHIPISRTLFHLNSDKAVKKCIAFKIGYNQVPCLYNSFVDVAILKTIASHSDGFFKSVTPDAYSGIAIASRIPFYIYSCRPFSVNGASGHSNGASTDAYISGERTIDNQIARFIRENDIPLHQNMPVYFIGSVVACVAEAFLQANDYCYDGQLKLDLSKIVRKIVQEQRHSDVQRYKIITKLLEDWTKGGPLEADLKRALKRYPHIPRTRKGMQLGLQVAKSSLTIDSSKCGTNNVYDASLLASAVLGDYRMPKRRKVQSLQSRIVAKIGRKMVSFLEPIIN